MIRKPTHPGNIIKEDYLIPLSMTIKDMADTQRREEAKLRKVVEEADATFYKLPPETAKWYLKQAYEAGWASDAKKYPSDVVAKFKKLLRR